MSLLAALLPLAAEDAATEGKKVITAMLIVGLIFVAVIAVGETTHWLRARRKARRRPTPY
jgi:heme/copper-type cytochrome/quinol oxidase subunit 2